MNNIAQPSNNGASIPKSEWESWVETVTSLAPLILLALMFMAVWRAHPIIELFRAHLETLKENGKYDEVTVFYLNSFLGLVFVIPGYIWIFQSITNRESYVRNKRLIVYVRNGRKIVLLSCFLGFCMFFALFINTINVAVDVFDWPASMWQVGFGGLGWFNILLSFVFLAFISLGSRLN